MSLSSDADTVETGFSDMTTSSSTGQGHRMWLEFLLPLEEKGPVRELYQPLLDWIDPELEVFRISQDNEYGVDAEFAPGLCTHSLDIPSLALVLFLEEEEIEGSRLLSARNYFNNHPWRFHHSEFVDGSRIKACPGSKHDYYLLDLELPLCSVRQIHCGDEHFRFVRFVSRENWEDTVNFYQLLLGQTPSAVKPDFCIFTLESFPDYDVQFSLKKLPKGITPRPTQKAVLSCRIPDAGSLVPLLPSPCHKVSEEKWVTADLDGNEVYLIVDQPEPERCRVRQVSLTPRGASLLPTLELLSEELSTCSLFDDTDTSEYSVNTFGCESFRPVKRRNSTDDCSHQHSDSGYADDRIDTYSSDTYRTEETEFADNERSPSPVRTESAFLPYSASVDETINNLKDWAHFKICRNGKIRTRNLADQITIDMGKSKSPSPKQLHYSAKTPDSYEMENSCLESDNNNYAKRNNKKSVTFNESGPEILNVTGESCGYVDEETSIQATDSHENPLGQNVTDWSIYNHEQSGFYI